MADIGVRSGPRRRFDTKYRRAIANLSTGNNAADYRRKYQREHKEQIKLRRALHENAAETPRPPRCKFCRAALATTEVERIDPRTWKPVMVPSCAPCANP